MLPGTILMGAQTRLLPVSVPFRHFLAAVILQPLLWVAVAAAAETIGGFRGGAGPATAAIHVLTLGVFAMTAMGAAGQLLPVATGVAHRSLVPLRVASWLFVPGLAVLLVGFYTAGPMTMVAGALPVALGLLIFVGAIADLLRRAKTLKLAVRFAWLALASLVGLVVLGFLLVADFHHGFFADHQAVGLGHMILAVFGFMGMLAFGFSAILVPMFALSPGLPEKPTTVSFFLALAALLCGLAGAIHDIRALLLVGCGLGLAASGVHLWLMRWSLAKGMRKNLGLSFVMVKASWVMLPVALLAGMALAAGWLPADRGPALFGALALLGWLLTFLLGILQRIVPFLASMNMTKKGKTAPRLSELADERWLTAHAVAHGLAVTAVVAGIGFDAPGLLYVAGAVGLSGGLCFAVYVWAVLRVFVAYHRDQPLS